MKIEKRKAKSGMRKHATTFLVLLYIYIHTYIYIYIYIYNNINNELKHKCYGVCIK